MAKSGGRLESRKVKNSGKEGSTCRGQLANERCSPSTYLNTEGDMITTWLAKTDWMDIALSIFRASLKQVESIYYIRRRSSPCGFNLSKVNISHLSVILHVYRRIISSISNEFSSPRVETVDYCNINKQRKPEVLLFSRKRGEELTQRSIIPGSLWPSPGACYPPPCSWRHSSWSSKLRRWGPS